MRIGLDVRPAFKPNSRNRGIGRFTYELVSTLATENQRHTLLLYTLPGFEEAFAGRAPIRTVWYLKRPSRLNWLFEPALFSYRIKRDRLDLFHATDLLGVPSSDQACVLATVHDLIPFVFWEETLRRVPLDYRYALNRAQERIQASDHILTVSKFSKNDLCRLWGLREDQVSVIYAACSDQLVPVERKVADEIVSRKFDLDDPFLLYVGGSDHRKNLSFLLEGYSKIREAGYPGRLVLAGQTFQMDIPEIGELRAVAKKLGVLDLLVFPGYVSDADLAALYGACDFFVFPSLYEGFGLPLLEAMRCRAPILCSHASCLPEIGGKVPVYFDPHSVSSFIEAFSSAYETPEKVEELRWLGVEREHQFSWRQAGRELISLYDRLMESSPKDSGRRGSSP